MIIFMAKNILLREEHGQMARAKRHFLPGHVWHITHRCHKKEFLLKFAKDRRRWLHEKANGLKASLLEVRVL